MEVAHHFIPLFQEVMELVMLLMAWGIVQTLLPPGSGRCFSGIELNYPFSTRGPVCDLFLFHSHAPPSAAHSGSSGQGELCGYFTLSALLFAAWTELAKCARQDFPWVSLVQSWFQGKFSVCKKMADFYETIISVGMVTAHRCVTGYQRQIWIQGKRNK